MNPGLSHSNNETLGTEPQKLGQLSCILSGKSIGGLLAFSQEGA